MYNVVKESLDKNKLSFNIHEALEYFGGNNKLSLDIYNEFINSYCDNFKNLDLILTEHLNNNNFNEITNIIHKIKGLAIYTGFNLFYQYSFYLYQKYLNNDFDNLNNEIKLLIKLNKEIIERSKNEKRTINYK